MINLLRSIGLAAALVAVVSAPACAGGAAAVGQPAPLFTLSTGQGTPFQLESRKGQWTVLYFYPKDDTPGCTSEACAFRDSIEVIRKKGAEVYGISEDSVESHQKFIAKHKLNFPLLADPGGQVAKLYGTHMVIGMSRRWTFIVDPALKIRWMQKNVDPALDAKEVAAELDTLQGGK